MNKLCRNCQSENIKTLNQGVLAPFFLKRVHGLYANSLGEVLSFKANNSQNNIKELFLNLLHALFRMSRWGRELLSFRSSVKVNIRVCKDCGFVGPEFNYEYDALSSLYQDYRSESYVAERINFEPSYEKIKNHVGKSKEEISVRLNNLDTFVNKYIDINQINNVMDWGGGEGKFIPTSFQKKNVWILDVSSEPLVNSNYCRVDQVPPNIKFDYVQVCHVLEHVASPCDFMTKVISHVNVGGYIYIELPQDRDDDVIQRLIEGDSNIIHGIHEHLNLFNTKSLEALATTLGLRVLNIEVKAMDYGWTNWKVISGLFLKQ
jgi:2-polyprenyl-3-methyl-5-hydroxy-6-metoxy-1,4-benzoquinol methylase